MRHPYVAPGTCLSSLLGLDTHFASCICCLLIMHIISTMLQFSAQFASYFISWHA
jgi:hypothetical protein